MLSSRDTIPQLYMKRKAGSLDAWLRKGVDSTGVRNSAALDRINARESANQERWARERAARAEGATPIDCSNEYEVIIATTGKVERYNCLTAAALAFQVGDTAVIKWVNKGVDTQGNKWSLIDSRIPLRDDETVAIFELDGNKVKVTSLGRHWNEQSKRWSSFYDPKKPYKIVCGEHLHNLMAFGFRMKIQLRFPEFRSAAECKTYREFRDAGWMADHILEIGDPARHTLSGIRISTHKQNHVDANKKQVGKKQTNVGRPLFCLWGTPTSPATAEDIANKVWPGAAWGCNLIRKSYTVQPNERFTFRGISFFRLPDPLVPDDDSILLRGVDSTGKSFVYNPENGAFKTSLRRMFTFGTMQLLGDGCVRYSCVFNGKPCLVYQMIGQLFMKECLAKTLERARLEAVAKGKDPSQVTIANLDVDHVNRLSKDNRLVNLRWATRRENTMNRSISVDQDYAWPCTCVQCVSRVVK